MGGVNWNPAFSGNVSHCLVNLPSGKRQKAAPTSLCLLGGLQTPAMPEVIRTEWLRKCLWCLWLQISRGPNYNLHLPSDLQFSVNTTMISWSPFCFLVGCDDHIHLTDGEADQKRQGELLKVTKSAYLNPGPTDSQSYSLALDQ